MPFVQDSLHVGTGFGSDGGGEDQPVGMQLFREIPQEAVVGLPVPAIDILKVNVHAVVVLFHSGVHNVLDQTVAGRFIGEQPAGKAAVKIAALLDVGHHHDGPGAARPGRVNDGAVGNVCQASGGTGVMAENTQIGQVGQGACQSVPVHGVIGIAVYINAVTELRQSSGNLDVLSDVDGGGVGDLRDWPPSVHPQSRRTFPQ